MRQKILVTLNVNNEEYEIYISSNRTLLDVLREDLELTGTKEGCSKGDCGACTVILNKKAVASCIFPAEKADGAKLETIEGLCIEEKLHPLQESFIKHHAVQCGFCTPGMIMATEVLLRKNPKPNEEEIRDALSGNLCRCTGYNMIIEGVKTAIKIGEELW